MLKISKRVLSHTTTDHRKVLVASAILAALAASRVSGQTAASSGPFGLRMGMTEQQLAAIGKLEKSEQGGSYVLRRVPKPHGAFESYLVLVAPKRGLCKVVAIGNTVETSVYGTELQAEFEQIIEPLSKKYGQHRKFDYLRAASIWKEPNDWMMSLVQKERYLSAYWDAEEQSNLTDDIVAISLRALALSQNKGYLRLAYEFSNVEACLAELKAEADEGL